MKWIRNRTFVVSVMVLAVGLLSGCEGGGEKRRVMDESAGLTGEALKAWIRSEMGESTLDRFEAAKDRLYTVVDRESDKVRCVYSGVLVKLVVNVAGSEVMKPEGGVDAEHTWPAKARWVGDEHHFDRETSKAGADLHNLFPTMSGLNRSRGNHRYGRPVSDVSEKKVDPATGRISGAGATVASGCRRGKRGDGETVFEPRKEHRGNAARAIFYMSVRYGMPVEDVMEKRLRAWHEEDPVDDAERARVGRVEGVQGNRNLFVDRPGLVGRVGDF